MGDEAYNWTRFSDAARQRNPAHFSMAADGSFVREEPQPAPINALSKEERQRRKLEQAQGTPRKPWTTPTAEVSRLPGRARLSVVQPDPGDFIPSWDPTPNCRCDLRTIEFPSGQIEQIDDAIAFAATLPMATIQDFTESDADLIDAIIMGMRALRGSTNVRIYVSPKAAAKIREQNDGELPEDFVIVNTGPLPAIL